MSIFLTGARFSIELINWRLERRVEECKNIPIPQGKDGLPF